MSVGLSYPFTRDDEIEALEREVERLSPEELAAFREWFLEHDWQEWDRQIDRDAAEGRLDRFAAEALAARTW